MPRLGRIGILTGGGDCPGLNAVLRAVTKKAILEHRAEVIGIVDGFDGLIRRRTRRLTYDDVSGILGRGGTILGTSNRGEKPDPRKAAAYVRKLGLDALVCVGGDGTMTIAATLVREGVRAVGVPKTIDNDVVGTDVTFGFDTAVSIAARALDDLHGTADAHGRVLVVEVMGRHAGWIALHAGIAGGADVILIPEIPFKLSRVKEYIVDRHQRRRFTILCVAEGVMEKAGPRVAREIERRTKIETRAVVLGHLQRGGSPTAADRVLATRYAAAALDLAAEGSFGRMAALQAGAMVSVPIDDVAGKTRKVPRDHELVRLARSVGATFG